MQAFNNFVRILAVASFACLPFFIPAAWAQDSLIPSANRAAAEYRQRIEHLAEWASGKGLAQEAGETLKLIPPSEPDKVFFPTFPRKVGTLDLSRGLPATLPRAYAEPFSVKARTGGRGDDSQESSDPEEAVFPEENPESETVDSETEESDQPSKRRAARQLTDRDVWQIQLRTIRQDYAKRLNSLARTAAKRDRGTLAVRMAIAGLQADPDMPVFRNVFGYAKYKGEWRTPWELDRLRKGYVDHELYGWIPQKMVKRYEKGERYLDGQWVDAAEEAAVRGGSIENGWQVQSEHYDIQTNHSLEEGVRLSRQIEDLYMVWKFLFFRYMATDPQLASLFDGKSAPIPAQRHRIVLYKNKDDFVRNFKPQSSLDVSKFAGFYQHGTRIQNACHFYSVAADAPEWQRGSVTRTMFHEATHQLFVEARAEKVSHYGNDANYWLIEGVATFMESLQREGDGYYSIGGSDDRRIRSLRNVEKVLPVDSLCMLSHKTFVGHPQMGDLYSESCALFHFLFSYEDGRWRDPMIVYLRAVYDGKDDRSTLSKITETSYHDLDRLFEEYLKGN